LAEDLGLPEGHRVQAAGEGEQVAHRAVLVVDVEVLGKQVHGHPGRGRDSPSDLGERAVERLGLGVDLDAVAGGDDDGLGDILLLDDAGLESGLVPAAEDDLLHQAHGSGAVGDADGEQAHWATTASPPVTPSARCCSWQARICTSVPRSTLRWWTPAGPERRPAAKWSVERPPISPSGSATSSPAAAGL